LRHWPERLKLQHHAFNLQLALVDWFSFILCKWKIFVTNVCNSMGIFFLLGLGICQETDYLAVFQLVLDQLSYSKCKFSYLMAPFESILLIGQPLMNWHLDTDFSFSGRAYCSIFWRFKNILIVGDNSPSSILKQCEKWTGIVHNTNSSFLCLGIDTNVVMGLEFTKLMIGF
jgi:hypothetical protein